MLVMLSVILTIAYQFYNLEYSLNSVQTLFFVSGILLGRIVRNTLLLLVQNILENLIVSRNTGVKYLRD